MFIVISIIIAVIITIIVIVIGVLSVVQFVGVEGFVTAVGDLFPTWMRRPYHRELFVLGVCIVSYLIGLVMVMQVCINMASLSLQKG